MQFKLKTPWRDGTAHLVMLPLEFMRRLAELAELALRPWRHQATTASRLSILVVRRPVWVGHCRPRTSVMRSLNLGVTH